MKSNEINGRLSGQEKKNKKKWEQKRRGLELIRFKTLYVKRIFHKKGFRGRTEIELLRAFNCVERYEIGLLE